jgi:SAM-dependent methyltransferase
VAADLPSARTVELTVGDTARVRLLFVEDDGILYIIPSKEDAGWFSWAVRAGGARIRWGDGREQVGASQVVYEPESVERLRTLFRAKYGDEAWRRYFAHSSRALAIDPHRPPVPRSADEVLREEFDSVAPTYDEGVARRPVERYLKDRAGQMIAHALQGLDPLLEIGPGTGYHTLPLLEAGHRVLAVDISDGMLDQLRRRAATLGVAGLLETRSGLLGDLGRILADRPAATYGGVFSAFGAFNLEADLGSAASALSRLVRPGGRLIFVNLNRPGLAPLAWELAMGRPAAAGRRLGEVIPPNGIRYPLELYLRTPAAWDRLLGEGFRRTRTEAVSVLAPPFDSDRALSFLGGEGSRRMRALDERLRSLPRAWMAAEWVALTYERTGGTESAPGPAAAIGPVGRRPV